MSKFSAAGLAIILALLGGCALAPGQHMDTGSLADGQGEAGSRIALVPITPKLIAMENAAPAPPAIPQALLDYRPGKYQVGAGDVLFITVWDHPELTAPSGSQQQIYANGRLVRPDGTLYYPYIGNVTVAGLGLDQVRQVLSKQLAEYVQQPQIDVNVITFASQRVWLNGAFRQTGTQPITVTPLTLAEALGKAQIDTAQADLSELALQRDGVEYHLDLDAMRRGLYGPADIFLKDGDHLYLAYNDRNQVYLMGEVNQPRALTFKTSDMSLTQALGQVGGLDQRTSKGKAVYVIRGVADLEKAPATVYQLDAGSPSALVLADNFKLQPGDVVYVGAAGVTRWNRLLSQLLPLSAILNQSAAARSNIAE
ncbi:polysaccharide biosynthesis/export family protein [Frateuria hangzhouensis]|uniref:polysaccharide biosynthesis/export family protein n=1 Tax=Frateuria hangzhouensis TaxID=2995589 RepID=UPI002260F3C8|nr:polysaccharide biosynthesis/export family protein [Frateuria sp. STR12]MCX7515279.1 polysaccharide biosynthesis/export family protein [Frateuria sp. STR12]